MYDALRHHMTRILVVFTGVVFLLALLQVTLLADMPAGHGDWWTPTAKEQYFDPHAAGVAFVSGAMLLLYGLACLVTAFLNRLPSNGPTTQETTGATYLNPQKHITDEAVAEAVFRRMNARFYQAQLQSLSVALNAKGFRFTTDQAPAAVPFFSLPHSVKIHAAESVCRERMTYLYPALSASEFSSKVSDWMVDGWGEKMLQDLLTALKEVGFQLEQFDQAASIEPPLNDDANAKESDQLTA